MTRDAEITLLGISSERQPTPNAYSRRCIEELVAHGLLRVVIQVTPEGKAVANQIKRDI